MRKIDDWNNGDEISKAHVFLDMFGIFMFDS